MMYVSRATIVSGDCSVWSIILCVEGLSCLSCSLRSMYRGICSRGHKYVSARNTSRSPALCVFLSFLFSSLGCCSFSTWYVCYCNICCGESLQKIITRMGGFSVAFFIYFGDGVHPVLLTVVVGRHQRCHETGNRQAVSQSRTSVKAFPSV